MTTSYARRDADVGWDAWVARGRELDLRARHRITVLAIALVVLGLASLATYLAW